MSVVCLTVPVQQSSHGFSLTASEFTLETDFLSIVISMPTIQLLI